MFFAKLFTGKIGELLAPSPKPKEEFHSFLKVSLIDNISINLFSIFII